MESSDCDLIIKALYDAFGNVEKPSPLATYDEAYDFEEVDISTILIGNVPLTRML
ncbi:MAG: hypothetical protein VXZ18_16260 [Pseudomonadota bacterium]|nr:hypothetical protein [Pseudomonadota bacterium]